LLSSTAPSAVGIRTVGCQFIGSRSENADDGTRLVPLTAQKVRARSVPNEFCGRRSYAAASGAEGRFNGGFSRRSGCGSSGARRTTRMPVRASCSDPCAVSNRTRARPPVTPNPSGKIEADCGRLPSATLRGRHVQGIAGKCRARIAPRCAYSHRPPPAPNSRGHRGSSCSSCRLARFHSMS